MSDATRTKPHGFPPKPIRDRILQRIDVSDAGCWVWKGWVDHKGYGTICIPNPRRTKRVHRVAYEEFVGPIPAGLTLDHLCRNRACVNPQHLEPVTTRENVLRGIGRSARNARATHCRRGHELSGANIYECVGKYGHRCRRCVACERARRQAKGEQ